VLRLTFVPCFRILTKDRGGCIGEFGWAMSALCRGGCGVFEIGDDVRQGVQIR
jgi:hypothetical protein